MTLRIGLVGAGANTRSMHIPGFQNIAGVEVVAVCNRSRASGQKVADEFGIPTVYDGWKELVHANDVDAVCVGTWPYLHCAISLETLSAGKHILTEARMAMNLAEARQMHDASQQSDRVSMIVPAPVYLESEKTLLKMIADGIFGDFLEININALGGLYDPKAPIHWRQRRDLSGNNIMALGIFNETVRRYVGHDRSLIAHAATFTTQRLDDEGRSRAVDVPESLAVAAALESGATAVYHISSVARLGAGAAIEMHGTEGAFKLQNGAAWIAGDGDSEFRQLAVRDEDRGGWRVEADFVDAIRDGAAVTHTSFANGVKYMEFTEAVQISLNEGRRVQLPLS